MNPTITKQGNPQIKDIISYILKALNQSKWNILLAIVLSIISIGSLVLVKYFTGVDYWAFVKDPIVVTTHPVFNLENPFFVGYFSQMGGMLWALTAGICLAGVLIAKNQPLPMKRMLLHAFIFTLFLGIDDVFMFHDEIFPFYGIHENIFMAAYILIAFSFLIIYFKTILETQFPLLALALLCFALSILLDKVPGNIHTQLYQYFDIIIFEDGFKMAGILFWLIYFTTVFKMSVHRTFTFRSIKN